MEKSVTEKRQIQKMPAKRKKVIDSLPKEKVNEIEGLLDAIESAGVSEFMEYIRSPWKMLWPNFVAGVARGFGALVGVTVVLAAIGWMFAITIDLPLIGKKLEPFLLPVQEQFNNYINQTNYSDEFRALESTLDQIEKNTQPRQ